MVRCDGYVSNFHGFFKMGGPVLILLAVGIFLRVSLFETSIADWFAERNEVTTPLTSWNRGMLKMCHQKLVFRSCF